MTVEERIEPNQDDLVMEEPQVSDVSKVDDEQTPKFNQRQVSDVVKRERERAYEKGRRDALMQQQAQQLETTPETQAVQMQQQAPTGLGGMPQGMNQDQVRQMIAELAPEALNSHIQQFKQDHLVNTFVTKMQAAEAKYPGLEQELNKLNYNDPRMHTFLELANAMDNTGDIMKEVIDNPSKLDQLLNLSQAQPYMAQKALQSLSQSIKQNEDAKAQEAEARDPMRQLKPSSTAGITDSSSMSVADYQKMFKQRR